MQRPYTRALIPCAGLCLAAGTLSAQVIENPGRLKPGAPRPGAVDQPRPVLQAAELAPGATIKRFGVGGPVTGGQDSFGLVELNGAAPAGGVTIQLSSNHPAISVPATITVAPGGVDQSFPVTTVPVASPTTVTVSAKIGAAAAPQTSTVTVVPPSLSFVTCTPQTVPAGTPTTCKVELDGPVASPSLGTEGDKRVAQLPRTAAGADWLALSITLSTSNAAVATVPATVRIGVGQRSASFEVTTKPLAQSASSLISASYGGATKGTTVHVQPVSLRHVSCGNANTNECEHLPRFDRDYGVWLSTPAGVRLTAPAPAGGLRVKFSDSPNLATFWAQRPNPLGGGTEGYAMSSILVPEGQSGASFGISSIAVAVDTRVTVTASAPLTGETRTLVVTVKAPVVAVLIFQVGGNPATISGVPIGGRKVRMYVRLSGSAPKGGWPLDFKYSGTTDITGPAVVTVPARGDYKEFDVTVGPCSVNPICEVVASTGTLSAKLFVKP